MINEQIYAELTKSKNVCIQKGNHFLLKLPEEDLSSIEHYDEPIQNCPELDQAFKYVFKQIENNEDNNTEFNLIFGCRIKDYSENLIKHWLLKTVQFVDDPNFRALVEEKMKHVKSIANNFLSVFTVDGKEMIKYSLKYTCLINKNNVPFDLIITPNWYDPMLINEEKSICSVYKIFYSISDQCSEMLASRFLTSEFIQPPNSTSQSIVNVLKTIGFSDMEIEEIFDTLHAVIELSQFTVSGNKKSLEFTGMKHFRMASKKLKIKEQSLHDFLVQEYTWKNNNKKLNSPQNINRDINSFTRKLYDVIIEAIFEQINKGNNHIDVSLNETKLNIFQSISLPEFNDKQLYTFGDFLQYSQSCAFEVALSKIIRTKVDTFVRCSRISIPYGDRHSSMEMIKSIPELILKYKSEKNKFDCLKKFEKNYGNKIRFLKNPDVIMQIFVEEFQIYAKFNWQSFVNNSQTFDEKLMKGCLKLSSAGVFQKYKIDSLQEKYDTFFDKSTSTSPMEMKNFTVHCLLDEKMQEKPLYPLKNQITIGYLDLLSIEEICSISIPFNRLVRCYGLLFLKHGDTSKSNIDASKHAITLLSLDKAWCSETHINLQLFHIEKLEALKRNFLKSVVKVQSYIRVIIAKKILRKLKVLSKHYAKIYEDTLRKLKTLTGIFESKFSEICTFDLENRDVQLVKTIEPNLKDIKVMQKTPFQWLNMIVMNGSKILANESFSNSQLCISRSNTSPSSCDGFFDIVTVLPSTIDKTELNPFIIRLSITLSGDVYLKFKAAKSFYVWNVVNKINKERYSHISLSSGKLHTEKEYRIFSMDYIIKKIAFSVMNRVPYSIKELVKECSIALIINEDPTYTNCLAKAPLWIYFTNFYPLCNLSATFLFTEVEKEIRNIDKKQCQKFVRGPSMRPKDDWLTEDVFTQLMLISLEKEVAECGYDQRDCKDTTRVSDPRPSIFSDYDKNWSKKNYKLRKYMYKNFI